MPVVQDSLAETYEPQLISLLLFSTAEIVHGIFQDGYEENMKGGLFYDATVLCPT